MSEILVLYASTHGHTGRIAAGVGRALDRAGASVDLRVVDGGEDLAPQGYDAVVVGASIHAGRHQKQIVAWARRHAASLNTMPSAFFSVSLTAAEDTAEAPATVQRVIDEFVESTGWTPTLTRSFAGALQYLEYGFATRQLMKFTSRRAGHPTDSHRDYDFTDWDAVERFGAECAALVSVAAVSS
jgi:menaquinone-dependent protoporphyrinogen oxidase